MQGISVWENEMGLVFTLHTGKRLHLGPSLDPHRIFLCIYWRWHFHLYGFGWTCLVIRPYYLERLDIRFLTLCKSTLNSNHVQGKSRQEDHRPSSG
jgi:hypothetical protein